MSTITSKYYKSKSTNTIYKISNNTVYFQGTNSGEWLVPGSYEKLPTSKPLLVSDVAGNPAEYQRLEK